MPIHEIALPVGAKNIDPQLPVVLRSSKDGNIPVVQLFGGDKFVGDVLEGQWSKGDDGVIVGPHTAIITNGQLEITGKAAVAANADYGWLNGKAPFPIVQDSYIDIHMEVPTVTPANEFRLNFFLRRESAIDSPLDDDDYIRVQLRRTTTPHTQIFIEKSIDNVTTTLYAPTGQTNDEGTFRIKFRPNDDKIDIYFHDGSGAVVEGTDELTLIDDTLDLTFSIGYPAFELETEDTTIRTLISDGVEVYYPDTGISYDQDVADLGKGDVKCYDTMGEASEALWMRVYSEDHDFTGDCVIENGLVRMFVDDGTNLGLKFYYWTGSAWSQPLDTIRAYQDTDAKTLTYSFFKQIVQMQRAEEIQLRVRLCDSATESDSYNTEFLITLARGKHHVMFEIDSVIPSQPIRFIYGNAAFLRWSYCGDANIEDIGDYDLSLTVTNTTLTDNFMMKFDDAGSTIIAIIGTNQKPAAGSSAFQAWTGKELSIRSVAVTDFDATEIHVGLIPFADVANLFKEAEDCTVTGGTAAFEDDYAVDSSGQYEEDLSDFTWAAGEVKGYYDATNPRQIRVKTFDFGSGDYEIVMNVGIASLVGSFFFCSDRVVSNYPYRPKNGWSVEIRVSNNRLSLYRIVNDSMTEIAYATVTFNIDTDYKITIHFDNVADTIKVDVDDVEKISEPDTSEYNSGAVGLGVGGGLQTGYVHYDDLSIDAEVTTPTVSGDDAVFLDKQYETVYHSLTAITDIPAGRYMLIARMMDLEQVASDAGMCVYNNTESRYLNEDMTWKDFTLTGAFTYRSIVFDILSGDSGDAIRFQARKSTATSNTIAVDYFLIVPITDGESLVQDIAHNELRTLDQGFRLADTATFEIFAGLGFSYGGTLGSAYTDAMAVAAVEAEPTLDLTGVLTAKRIKNQLDNEGFFTGAGDDLRLYHDGTDSYIVNSQGNLILQNVGGDIQLETQDFFLDSTGKVQIRDKDDSDAVLFELDTTARTLKIGTAIDPIATTFSGNIDAQAYYTDMGEIAVPANPAANVRRIFVSSVTNELSVRTNAGATVSLEGAGGGPGSGTQWTIPVWATATTLGDSMVTQDAGGTTLTIGGSTTINTIVAGVADYDKFLVSDTGIVKFRTGAEAYADMGGYVTADFTSDFAAESLANLGTRAHSNLSDAPTSAHHIRYANSEVESVITAELVDGQSIDNAIDALISTHNVANKHIDHSAVSVTAGTGLSGGGTIALTRTINCDITQYTNALAIAAIVAENPLSLTNAIKIGANSIEDSVGSEMIGFDGSGFIDFLAGQGTPTDNDVLAWDISAGKWVVQAQVGGGGGDWFKTITGITNDVVADASDDILTLASGNNMLTIVGVAATDTITFTVVEANISHDAIADVSIDDHHAQSHNLASHSDVTMTGPQLVGLTSFNNSVWFTCFILASSAAETWDYSSGILVNPTATSQYLLYHLPQPTNRGSLKMHVNKLRIGLQDADPSNYIDAVYVEGVSYTGRTLFTVADSGVNKTAPALCEWTITDVDASGYETVGIEIGFVIASAYTIGISSVSLQCYYI